MKTPGLMVQEHKVEGEKLLARVKEIVHQGNVRRIIIKNDAGITLMEVPLTVGVMGAVLLPVWVALGAIAAVAAHYRIAVETRPETAPTREAEPAAAPESALASAGAFHARVDV
jgi:hypothetical protein